MGSQLAEEIFFPTEIGPLGFELIVTFKKLSAAFECLGFSVRANQKISNMLSKSLLVSNLLYNLEDEEYSLLC